MPQSHECSIAPSTAAEFRDNAARAIRRRSSSLDADVDRAARFVHPSARKAVVALRIAGVLLVSIGCAPSTLPAQARKREARVYQWSEPAEVNERRSDRPVIAYEPMLALLGSDRFLVGTNLRGAMARVPANPLTAWRLGGASIGRPEGTFSFVHPRAYIDSNRFLHLLWAEPESVSTGLRGLDWPPEPLKSIWTATYEQGHGWSAPEKLYTSKGELEWSSDGLGTESGGHSHQFGIAAMEWTERFPSLVLLFWKGTKWQIEQVRDAGFQPSLASSDGKTFYLAYIAAARDRAHDSNSLFGRWSHDGGVSWSAPVLLQRGGDHGANAPQLHSVDGLLHVIWRQSAAPARFVLRHAVWRKGDSSLGVIDDVDLPPEAQAIASAVDSCGVIHLAYSHRDSTGAHVDHLAWLGHWSSVNHLLSARAQGDVTLGIANGQRGIIAFNGTAATDDMRTAQAMYMTAQFCTPR